MAMGELLQLAHPVLVLRDMAKKILVVEDNDDCRYLLTRFLKSVGYEVVEAATGLQGVHLACRVRPDLILMDLSLPTLSGDEATARIKANQATRDIPVVINTAWVIGDRCKRALEAGASEVLHKPVELSELHRVLKKYLEPEHVTGHQTQNC
jgi:two-component system, cell cycle response regulator DivK